MKSSGRKSASGAHGRGRSVGVIASPLIISLALVALLTITVGPTMANPHVYLDNSASETRVSEATTHFGLSLMKAMSLKTTASPTASGANQNQQQNNTVLSPLSLQILLNMILLGTNDQSLSQAELARVLGYGIETSGLRELSLKIGGSEDAISTSARLGRPHEAIHSVVESIKKATRSPADYRDSLHTGEEIATKGASSSDESSQSFLHRQFQAPSQTATRDTPLESDASFTLANLMLSNKDLVEMSPAYESELKSYYDVKVERFSRQQNSQYKKDTTGSKKLKLHERINNWVKNITRNQITDLADEESLSNEALILVLLNAVHFKGRWLNTFEPESTRDRIFYNNGQSSAGVRTKFMHQTSWFGYAEFNYRKEERAPHSELSEEEKYEKEMYEFTLRDKRFKLEVVEQPAPKNELSTEERRRLELTANISCRALSLPFSLNHGQEMSMVVLLPSQRDGLDKLIESLNVEVLTEIYRSLNNQEVRVSLPKFKIEASHDGKAMPQKLGVERIFRLTAELDRMFIPTANIPAYVDKIIHKAKISVDEQGTEAAAASMAVFLAGSSQPDFTIRIPPAFVADHPFLYIIRHNRSNMPLFMGQVRNF